MKAEEWFADLLKERQNSPDFQTSKLLLDLTEQLWARMQELGLSKAELAERLGVSQSMMTRMLDGQPHMTLATLVTVALALETRVEIRLTPPKDETVLNATASSVVAGYNTGNGSASPLQRSRIHDPIA